MTGKTHLAAGILIGEAFRLYAGTRDLPLIAGMIILSGVGSLMPDIDLPNSTISKRNKATRAVSSVTSRVFTHRGFTHTLPFLLITASLIFWILSKIKFQPYLLTSSYIVGFLSHLLLDSLNEKGVMWLWPLSDCRIYLAKIRTGSKKEKRFRILINVVATCILGVMVYSFMPVETIKNVASHFGSTPFS